MNDCELIEAVRTRSEIYDKSHAGFKKPAIKEAAWKAIAEAIGGTPAECITRWGVLRDRFSKENRLRVLQTRSGAGASGKPEWIYFKSLCFLKSHIRQRNSVCNLPRRTVAVNSIETPTITTNDDDIFWTQLNLSPEPEQMRDTSKDVENTEDVKTEYTVHPTYPVPETPSTSSSAAASLPYLGPTGRCKKAKIDDTTILFKETLTNMNKSLSAETNPCNDPDSLIGRSVDLALKNVKTPAVKLHFRKKI